MSTATIILTVLSVVWGAVLVNQVIELIQRPLSRSKRNFILFVWILGAIALVLEWFTRAEIHAISIIATMLFQTTATIMFHMLDKLDYYLDDLMQEVLLISILFMGISLTTTVWYEGVSLLSISAFWLRVTTASIPAVLLLLARYIGHSKTALWSLAVYVGTVGVKWVLLPMWGIWSLVVVLMYALLAGNVIHWMTTTTYAEKVLAWNIRPAKLWIALILAAGVVVFSF
jgi:hypothetical protein